MREENNNRRRLRLRFDWPLGDDFQAPLFRTAHSERNQKHSFGEVVECSARNTITDCLGDLPACGDAPAEPWTLSSDKRAALPIAGEIASELDIVWSFQYLSLQYEVVLHFVDRAAITVGQVNWHASQQTHAMEDGSLLVTFRLVRPETLIHWLLEYGNNVTVLRPLWLSHQLRLASGSA